MAMSAGPADVSPEDEAAGGAPMTDINTTPLVDVMLVLLIIFLIAVPVVIQTVPLRLPKVSNQVTTTKPENVLVSIDSNCDVYWGLQRFSTNAELLDKATGYLIKEVDRLKASGAPIELPEVHIRGDADAEYRCVGGVIFTMQRAGYQKVGFISEPVGGVTTR
ncbi:ExbD/TolR family protein [Sphingoaurantiacus capsulatus]|uniref:ExbD/TolR family protein n=1 Tax=Sphingoaurantiacus capsulatus TaxID=1771310 RepID=A0ABV7XER7_9SPHN